MKSLEQFMCMHPYFSLLIFVAIGFLLRGMKQVNFDLVRINLEELEFALEDKNFEKANYILQKLKTGFGFKEKIRI